MGDSDLHTQHLPAYSPPEYQLILEIYVSSLERSIPFYQSLGFDLDWHVPNIFAQVSWDRSILFLKVKDASATVSAASPANGSHGAGNVRIMVPDVEMKYKECKKLGCTV